MPTCSIYKDRIPFDTCVRDTQLTWPLCIWICGEHAWHGSHGAGAYPCTRRRDVRVNTQKVQTRRRKFSAQVRRPATRKLRASIGQGQCVSLVPGLLDCYWVGSLDFNFWGNQGVFRQTPQTVFLAGGSTATKLLVASSGVE